MLCALLMAQMLLCIVYGTDVIMPISCNILLHWCYCALFMAKMLLSHFFSFCWAIISFSVLGCWIIYYPRCVGDCIFQYSYWVWDYSLLCTLTLWLFWPSYCLLLQLFWNSLCMFHGHSCSDVGILVRGLQVFLVSFPKCSPWFTNVLFTTVNAPTGVAIYYTVLTGDSVFIFRWH